MNCAELSSIIRYIKEVFPCSMCKKPFNSKEIITLATLPNECLLATICGKCNANTILSVVVMPAVSQKTERKIMVRTANAQNISTNEILDIKNFLKSFKGDFKEIFQ